VQEVVTKLDVVARAMKGVELESNEIWHDSENTNSSGSVTTETSGS
jgi:hypothetical protein